MNALKKTYKIINELVLPMSNPRIVTMPSFLHNLHFALISPFTLTLSNQFYTGEHIVGKGFFYFFKIKKGLIRTKFLSKLKYKVLRGSRSFCSLAFSQNKNLLRKYYKNCSNLRKKGQLQNVIKSDKK